MKAKFFRGALQDFFSRDVSHKIVCIMYFNELLKQYTDVHSQLEK